MVAETDGDEEWTSPEGGRRNNSIVSLGFPSISHNGFIYLRLQFYKPPLFDYFPTIVIANTVERSIIVYISGKKPSAGCQIVPAEIIKCFISEMKQVIHLITHPSSYKIKWQIKINFQQHKQKRKRQQQDT